jgi:hypothetical protein
MNTPSEHLLLPEIFQDQIGITAGFTTRHGGVSSGPFSTLNLGLSTGDDSLLVEENRRRMLAESDLDHGKMAIAGQVHGNRIKSVVAPGLYPGYDALVTRELSIVLCITAADCAVILLADAEAGVIGACHAGWRGTVANIIANTTAEMERIGAEANRIHAYVSPCICVDHFEVGEEVAEKFSDKYVVRRDEWERPHVDLKSAIAQQLAAVSVVRVEISERCTFSETEIFFSHRAERGVTGRMMGFICSTIDERD